MPARRPAADRHLYLRDGAVYFRIKIAGVEGPVLINQSLGRIDLPTARRVRDALVTTLNGAVICAKMGLPLPELPKATRQFGAEAMLEKLGAISRRRNLATIGEVLLAFELDATGRQIKERTVRDVCYSLKNLVRQVHGADFDVDAAPASILTEQLCVDFKAARLAAAKDKGPAAVESAGRSVASLHAQARSVFARDALKQARMRALLLPDLTGFTEWKSGFSTVRVRAPWDDARRTALGEAIDALWFTNPAAWLGLALCGYLGLRRGSAVMARWSWVRQVDGVPTLFLLTTDEATPKGNETRVQIPDSLWADFLAHRQEGSDYIVPGATAKERERVLLGNVDWLREQGMTVQEVQKPNHELRAILLQRVYARHGMHTAQATAGHGDAKTTTIYTGRGTGRAERW